MPRADDETIRILARQAARWATASSQDENALVALLHGNYGAAYVFALRQVAHDTDIRRVTGVDPVELEATAVSVQDLATAKLLGVCPTAAPRGKLAPLAREGLLGQLLGQLPEGAGALLGAGLLGVAVLGSLALVQRRVRIRRAVGVARQTR